MALTPVILLPISYFVFKEKLPGRQLWEPFLPLPELPFYFWHNREESFPEQFWSENL
jgi:hypothetical protein